MAMDNEQVIRRAYKYAEDHDVPGWVASFAEGRTFPPWCADQS